MEEKMSTHNLEIGGWAEHLLSVAMAKCGNLEDAQDLTQETLLTYLVYKASGKSVDNDAAFLHAVLTRKYYDLLRRKYQLPTVSIDDEAPMAEEQDFMSRILRREQAEEIRREVAFLAHSYRIIIAGHYFHGKSVKTLSEELQLPQGTVKSRLDFGRKQLKKGLETMENKKSYTENSYIPQHLRVCNSGVCGLNDEPMSLAEDDNPLAQNLLILAYERPVSISDLSRAIGVASAYVEPAVDKLVKGELMKRMGDGKVYTDFIIYHKDDFTKYVSEQTAFAKEHAQAYCEAVRSAAAELKETSFYSLRLERYMLINIAESGLWRAMEGCRPPQVFPQRPNGGRWIAFGTLSPNEGSCQPENQDDPYSLSGQRCTRLDRYLNSGRIALYNYESSLGPRQKYSGLGFGTFQELETAILKLFYLIKHEIDPETVDCDPRILKGIPLLEERGFLTTENGRPALLIPCLSPSEERQFWDICERASHSFALQIRRPLSEYIAGHRKQIPAHLKSVPDQKLSMPYEPCGMMFVFEAIRQGLHPGELGYPCPETFTVME